MRTLKATVNGMVQGVWFRAWTRDVARALGLNGSVRNLPDGTVEVTATGTQKALTSLLGRLQDGPPLARVSNIETEWSDFNGEETGFHVRR